MRVSAQLREMCDSVLSSMPKEAPTNHDGKISRPSKPISSDGDPAEVDQCLRHLFLSNPLDDIHAMKRMKGERAEGTCEWIMETEEMKTWLSPEHSPTAVPSSNFLWLQGDPGVGKSTMAVFIAEHLLRITAAGEESPVAFFLCSSTFDTRNTATAILRGLLWQVFSKQRQMVSRHILPSYRVLGPNLFVSFDSLWSIFLDVMSDQGSGTKYLIIDGIDECKEGARFALLKQLKGAFGLKGLLRASNQCRLLILSRPSPDVQRAFRGSRHVNLSTSPEIKKDISRFIDEKVTDLRLSIPYPPAVAENVTRILQQKAGGTFLWAGIACTELENCDAKDAIRCLETLPSTLNDMYRDILDSAYGHTAEKKRKVRRLLGFAITALYPLSLLELSTACNLHTEHSGQTRAAFMLEEIECCRRLLVMDNGKVHVLHESVKDFLRGEESGNFINEQQAHAQLADRCIELVYWSSIDVETSSSRSLVWSGSFEWSRFDTRCGHVRQVAEVRVPEKDVFLGYAVFRWPEHARLACQEFIISGLTLLFLDSRSVSWKGWAALFLPYIMHSSTDSGHSDGYGGNSWLQWTALDVAALTDTPTLAMFALQRQKVKVEGRHLMYAAVEKHWQLFDTLLGNLRVLTSVSEESIEDFIRLRGSLPQVLEILRTLLRHPKVRLLVTPLLLLAAVQVDVETFRLLFEQRPDGMRFSQEHTYFWMKQKWKGECHAQASRSLAESHVPGFTDSDVLMEHVVSMGRKQWPKKDILDILKILCDAREEYKSVTRATWLNAAGNAIYGPELIHLLMERDTLGCVAELGNILKNVVCNLEGGAGVLSVLSASIPTEVSAAISSEILALALKQATMEQVHQLLKLSLFDENKLEEEDMLVAAASNLNRNPVLLFSDSRILFSSITERVLISATNNEKYGRALMEVLLDVHKDILPLSEAVIVQAAQNNDGLFDVLLDRQAFHKSIITPALYERIELGDDHKRSGRFTKNLLRRRDPALPIPDLVAVARHLTYQDAEALLAWQGDGIVTKKVVLPTVKNTTKMDLKEDILPLVLKANPTMVIVDTQSLDAVLSLFPTAGWMRPRRLIDRVREVRGGKLLEEEEEAVKLWLASKPHLDPLALRKEFQEARRKYLNYDTTGGKEPVRTNCYPGSTGGVTPRRDRRATICIPLVLTKASDEVEGRKRRMSVCSGPAKVTTRDGGKALPLGC